MSDSQGPTRLNAAQAAIVVLYAIEMYRREKEKEVNRIRFSRATMRRLCVRTNLHDTFAAEVASEVAELGWTMFPAEDDFGLIHTSTLKGWVRLGSKRIAAELKQLRKGNLHVLGDMMAEITIDSFVEDAED